jgi:hypothetical protein
MSTLKILFEPWNLGDAIIAASVARTAPDQILLACNSNWHDVLRLATGDSLQLLPLDLPYVWRKDKRFFSLGDAASLRPSFNVGQHRDMKVISIRGDVRDWIAARRIFNGATFAFSGWFPFCARKISILDLPFKFGCLEVRNRYKAWAEAAAVPFNIIENTYLLHSAHFSDAPVVIHVGAQWRSKQYPHVEELVELLKSSGIRVEMLAGPNDPLPPKISPDMVQRPKWPELVARLRSARHVITNDSGPMHLAAFLGCRVIALSRCSNILEWIPAGVTALSSPSAPRGYRPVKTYWSDQILTDWPSPTDVLACLNVDDRLE